ncbi:MAG: hypothetical protein Q9211_007126, partial [Gyalolechia sp. 1 TL-2023]
IEVEFKIHGQGSLHGDGMAIWLTKQRGQIGPVFGSVDRFEGLGIFIDTYKNQRPGVVFPYVMAMVGNSSVTYDKDHDGKENEIAGCSVRLLFLPPSSSPPYATYPCIQRKDRNLASQTSQLTQRNPRPGPRHPFRVRPHENPAHLLRRKVLNRRPPIQSRKRMDRVLRNRTVAPPFRLLPRLLRRNGRVER